MARPHTPETRGTEMPLPGIWHWLVMIPVAAFALLVCAGVLWMIAVSPLAERIVPPATAVPTAAPPRLAVADVAGRADALRRYVEGNLVGVAWRGAVTGYRVEGETVIVETSLPRNNDNSVIASVIAQNFLDGMHRYGDPVTRAVVTTPTGETLIALACNFLPWGGEKYGTPDDVSRCRAAAGV